MSKFSALDKMASEMRQTATVRARVNEIIAHADENAKSMNGDHDDCALASVESLLAHEPDAKVRQWFIERGVSF